MVSVLSSKYIRNLGHFSPPSWWTHWSQPLLTCLPLLPMRPIVLSQHLCPKPSKGPHPTQSEKSKSLMWSTRPHKFDPSTLRPHLLLFTPSIYTTSATLALCSYVGIPSFHEKPSLASSFKISSDPHYVLSIFSAFLFSTALITICHIFSYLFYSYSLSPDRM